MCLGLMQLFGWNAVLDQLVEADGVRWHGHVSRKEGGHALRKFLEFVVEGQSRKGMPVSWWWKSL